MAVSALEAIETSTTAAVVLVSGVSSAQAVPVVELFQRLPASYPGANVGLNEDETEADFVRQNYNTTFVIYRVPVYVALFATSDGTVEAGARRKAWEVSEAIVRRLAAFTPTGHPADVTMFPLEPGNMEPILVDANTHGMLLQFWAKYSLSLNPG